MGRYGMAGDHYRQSGYVTLQDVPDPNREYVESFTNLTGGMNLFDLDYRLKGNESPFLQNLSWHNGTLTSRLGQVELEGELTTSYKLPTQDGLFRPITYVSVAPFLFYGWMLVQGVIEDAETPETEIYAVKMQNFGLENEEELGFVASTGYNVDNVDKPGTFVLYRDKVLFKAPGAYAIFEEDLTSDRVFWDTRTPYVPVIQLNTNPASGAGDPFQKENRLTDAKIVEFNYAYTPGQSADPRVFQLPVGGVTSAVVYDGAAHDPDNFYELDLSLSDLATGKVAVQTVPPQDCKVYVRYIAPNPDAIGSIMDSSVITVFGGSQELCVVIGGPDVQPNSYFWSGINGNVMDPMYFPMNQYNLAGDNDDPITAFGKQQNMLVIFQPHAVGRAVFGTEKINDLETVTMNYTRINAEIGCDLPGSLQLVENNLVWCSRKYGVCRLKDSSAAYENNIVQISRKINGDYRLDGLLEQLKSVADDAVRSTDTGKRYILVLGDQDGKAYEWNYELSQYDNPSWFYHTNILGVGFVPLANEELYEVTADGKVCTFEMVFKDFDDTPINKIYRFPPRDFGSYDRLKNIKSILVTTRSDAKTNTQLKYTCDYAERVDPTNLVVILNRLLYAAVFRRKPGYHNIHHLGIELSNNVAGDDLNIVSAQIFYEYRGRTR